MDLTFVWFFVKLLLQSHIYVEFSFFSRGLIEGIVTTNNGEVLSFKNRREKDRIGENQPFQEQTFSVHDKIRAGQESNYLFVRFILDILCINIILTVSIITGY
jgi:hypothetical protein